MCVQSAWHLYMLLHDGTFLITSGCNISETISLSPSPLAQQRAQKKAFLTPQHPFSRLQTALTECLYQVNQIPATHWTISFSHSVRQGV